ncbi:MAG: hypothetical protein GX333_07590 [Syntrophomonadaceae bacterium]|nr:hypothetical protein [Syntrophomonadaceae bacterium]
MRKYFTLILLSIFLCTNTLVVLADGIGNDQLENYLGVIDYRDFSISNNLDHLRPKAGFALQINSNGVLANEILSENGMKSLSYPPKTALRLPPMQGTR